MCLVGVWCPIESSHSDWNGLHGGRLLGSDIQFTGPGSLVARSAPALVQHPTGQLMKEFSYCMLKRKALSHSDRL